MPQTMAFLGDDENKPLGPEVTSAIMGFKVGDRAAESILEKMNECAWDLAGCHYPDGSYFGNQKRDQSALNSILRARATHVKVHKDEIYWAFGSQSKLKVTDDETSYNGIVFYSRRGIPRMKYIAHIKPEPPEVVETGKFVDVHFGTNSKSCTAGAAM